MDNTESSTPPEVEDYPVEDLYAAAWIAIHGQHGYATSDLNRHYTWWFADTPDVRRLHTEYRDHDELHRWERAKRNLRTAGDEAYQDALANASLEELAGAHQRVENERNRRIAAQVSPGVASRQAMHAEANRKEWEIRHASVRRAQRGASTQEDVPGQYRRDDDYNPFGNGSEGE